MPRRSFLQLLRDFSVQILICLIIGEIVVRIWAADISLNPNWKYHPILGWSQIPNSKYEYKVVSGETVSVSFNSLGFRDHEHTKTKPEGVKRIVVLGDSISEAIQVNLQDTYFSLLQQKLNSNPNQKWEIINLGVGDFGTTQEWITLNEFGLSYDPDIVILQIFPLNDICNNSIELFEACGSVNDRYRPYFVESNGDLHLRQVQPLRSWLRRNIKLYGILERAYYQEKSRISGKNADQLRDEKVRELGFKTNPELYTYAPTNQQVAPINQGWSTTEKVIKKISDLANQRNIKLIAMVVPFEFAIGNANWASFCDDKSAGVQLIKDYPEERLDVLFNRIRIPSVLLLNKFEKQADEVLPYVDGHLNRAGHKLAAKELYEEIRNLNP
jgi:hypothetical protein